MEPLMKNELEISRGDIIRCDFGNYQDLPGGSTKGERPAVVIQNDTGNKYGNHIIVAIVSRKQKRHIPVLVNFSHDESPLPRGGSINCAHIFTVGKQDVIAKEGSISNKLMQKVDEALRISLALD